MARVNRILVFAVSMLLTNPAWSQNRQLPSAAVPATTSSGSFFFAYRAINFYNEKPRNRQKWQEIVDEVPNFLKSKGVALVSDPLRNDRMTSDEVPMGTLLNIAKDAGASHILYLTLGNERQVNARLKCFDLSGRELWTEASKGSAKIHGGAIKISGMLEKFEGQVQELKGQLAPRIGQECLAVTPNIQSSSRPDAPR